MQMKNNKKDIEGAAALLASALIYASFGVLIRELAKMWGDYAQVFARFFIALLLIVIYNFLRKNTKRLSKENKIRASLLGLTFVGVLLLFTISVNSTKLLTAFSFYMQEV